MEDLNKKSMESGAGDSVIRPSALLLASVSFLLLLVFVLAEPYSVEQINGCPRMRLGSSLLTGICLEPILLTVR